MGCKLSISVVHPSKSPPCKKKTIDIPESPNMSSGSANDKCSLSDTSDDDSDIPPDVEEGNIFSGNFKGRFVP